MKLKKINEERKKITDLEDAIGDDEKRKDFIKNNMRFQKKILVANKKTLVAVIQLHLPEDAVN